jgi:hypothetical protein
MIKKRESNTRYFVSMEEKCINFLSQGGNPYNLPFDMDLVSIRPLMEGILIGWGKNDFNYCVLLNHPLA